MVNNSCINYNESDVENTTATSTSLVVKLTGLLNAHVMMVWKVKMEPSALTSMNVQPAITIVTLIEQLVSTSITHSNACDFGFTGDGY